MIDIVANELSFEPIAPTLDEARTRMTLFAEVLAAARNAGFRGDFRVHENFAVQPLFKDYCVLQWMNDGVCPQDQRTYMRSQATKSPFLAGLPELQELFGISEFRFRDRVCQGLGATHLLAAIAISLDSSTDWRANRLVLKVFTLSANGESIEESSVEVLHICRFAELAPHKAVLFLKNLASVHSARDLWEKRGELFPNLAMGPDVERQLGAVTNVLPHVVRRLSELQEHVAAWKSGQFSPQGLNGEPRTESAKTLEEYGDQRTFQCSDGIQRTFSWHVSLPGGRRLYFFPEENTRRVFVGYIGKHLDTARFN